MSRFGISSLNSDGVSTRGKIAVARRGTLRFNFVSQLDSKRLVLSGLVHTECATRCVSEQTSLKSLGGALLGRRIANFRTFSSLQCEIEQAPMLNPHPTPKTNKYTKQKKASDITVFAVTSVYFDCDGRQRRFHRVMHPTTCFWRSFKPEEQRRNHGPGNCIKICLKTASG